MENLVIHNVNLGQSQNKLEQIDKTSKKSVIVQDQTGNLKVFLNYKGCVIDFSEFLIKLAMGSTDLASFQEVIRRKLVVGLQVGYQTALNFDKILDPSKTIS